MVPRAARLGRDALELARRLGQDAVLTLGTTDERRRADLDRLVALGAARLLRGDDLTAFFALTGAMPIAS
jgi:hypothetical protein